MSFFCVITVEMVFRGLSGNKIHSSIALSNILSTFSTAHVENVTAYVYGIDKIRSCILGLFSDVALNA